ncbi:MAG: hypothetical protein FJW40_13315 [Acidobacteria bacterium]|nr:hypothetical protein [Acidobacteriota bacterium]
MDEQIRHVQSLLGRAGAAPASISIPAGEKTAKRLLSPDARKRIAAAQKRRWAAYRAAKKSGQAQS